MLWTVERVSLASEWLVLKPQKCSDDFGFWILDYVIQEYTQLRCTQNSQRRRFRKNPERIKLWKEDNTSLQCLRDLYRSDYIMQKKIHVVHVAESASRSPQKGQKHWKRSQNGCPKSGIKNICEKTASWRPKRQPFLWFLRFYNFDYVMRGISEKSVRRWNYSETTMKLNSMMKKKRKKFESKL